MQLAVIGVLLVLAGVFVMSSKGGGEEEAESSASATGASVESTATEAPVGLSAALAMVSQASAAHARPLPSPVVSAWKADKTVVLLFVHDGGIDDRLVKDATGRLQNLQGVATFVIPAGQISRYAAVTEGVGVNRVPALVVHPAQAGPPDGPVGLGQLRLPERRERRSSRGRRRLPGPDAPLPPMSRKR